MKLRNIAIATFGACAACIIMLKALSSSNKIYVASLQDCAILFKCKTIYMDKGRCYAERQQACAYMAHLLAELLKNNVYIPRQHVIELIGDEKLIMKDGNFIMTILESDDKRSGLADSADVYCVRGFVDGKKLAWLYSGHGRQ